MVDSAAEAGVLQSGSSSSDSGSFTSFFAKEMNIFNRWLSKSGAKLTIYDSKCFTIDYRQPSRFS